MKIGVDATCWQNTRGYGRHARALLRALVNLDKNNRYTLFMDSPCDRNAVPSEAEVRMVRTSLPTAMAASAHGHRSISDICRMSRALSDATLDVLLFPTVYSYVPVFSRAKKVVMIHDAIAEKYPDLTVPRRSARLFWQTKVALGRWQADCIVTVSDYSRKGILEHFGLAPDRVYVVGEASDPIFCVLDDPEPSLRLRSLGLVGKDRSIVYVGGFGPHKNLEALLGAFAKLYRQTEFVDSWLVLVGEYEDEAFHSYIGAIKEQIETLGLTGRVIFTGYLPDADLVTLLNLATVLVLPSFMEGFGLPAIEAAACGCPVIATSESPLPALLGESALYIDPHKSDELYLALTNVLASENLRQQMREGGVAAAGRLTWKAMANQMINVINSVAMR